jgi:predicted RND superfamily exporter protein
VVGTHWTAEFARSQVSIVSAASLVVFGLIGLYLRSFWWALLAMVPNAVALALLFGAMGHWGVPLDLGSAIVAPVAIGIAADDTIHFLTAYARERRSGHEAIDALRRAITGVGEAVIATSTALALGFLSMLASPFPSISSLGFLSALAISAATLADLIVLPALIASFAAARSPLAALGGRSAAACPTPDPTPSPSRTGRSS